METKATAHVITTPYVSSSRRLANSLVEALNLTPGAVVEVNARHTDVVSESFAEELTLVLFQEKFVSKILVRGTIPGMFSVISATAEKHGFLNRVEAIPLSSR
jgi:hypothetical protein